MRIKDVAIECMRIIQHLRNRTTFLNGAFYNQVYRELLTYILADPRCIDQANFLLWVAHNLERAPSRTTALDLTLSGCLLELALDC
jgi:hypothetical protein